MPVLPERMMFRVHDPVAELETPGGPVPPADSLISTSRDQLLVSCSQEHLGVQLTIEEWDDAPPPFSDGYEDEAKCVLYLRGKLSVDMGSAGRAVESIRLSGGGGGAAGRAGGGGGGGGGGAGPPPRSGGAGVQR